MARLVAVVCLVAAIAVVFLRPWAGGGHAAEAGQVSATTALRPGQFVVTLQNGSDHTVRLAQVTVNDAFVNFRAQRLAVAAHEQTELTIEYAWVRGESYEIGVLTSSGAIVDSEVDGAGES